jgi:hypothetical protein
MSNYLPDPHRTHTPPRPMSVTILVLGVLTIAGFNLIRFYQAIRLWDFLSEFPTVSPLYLAASGLIWGIAGVTLANGLWRGYPPARRFTLIFIAAYTLYYWIDRLLVSKPELSANLPFFAGLNFILWVATVWILTRPRVRAFFGAMHER